MRKVFGYKRSAIIAVLFDRNFYMKQCQIRVQFKSRANKKFCGGAGLGSLENFRGRGGPGQLFFLGRRRGVHPCKVYSTCNCATRMCVLCVPNDDPVNGFEPEYLSCKLI